MDKVQLTIDTIRVLSAQAIEKAKSGHPGLPLGVAPLGYTLFANNLKFNPKNPSFVDRDRFILSAGHGSMLLYSLLHIFGYDVTIDDIKNFRQLGSKCPGHPELGVTAGVEISTGPLGQGIANAVGMAIAETFLAEKFNKTGLNVVDHYTYALCGDGCMMEGIEYEAASLAGTLKLGKLIVLYDSNSITIEGDTNSSFTEDVAARHEAQGWQVLTVEDVNNIADIDRAIAKAKAETSKPSLIIVKSIIGYGSPKAGSADVHGAPLGEVALDELKKNLNWEYAPFEVPEEVLSNDKTYIRKGAKVENDWQVLFDTYQREFPELAQEFLSWQAGTLPSSDILNELYSTISADATRGS
ncbi:MAG: transketolase, partial [Clostridia bacterium]|nr:transketolase [Clostridia bacterium]